MVTHKLLDEFKGMEREDMHYTYEVLTLKESVRREEMRLCLTRNTLCHNGEGERRDEIASTKNKERKEGHVKRGKELITLTKET